MKSVITIALRRSNAPPRRPLLCTPTSNTRHRCGPAQIPRRSLHSSRGARPPAPRDAADTSLVPNLAPTSLAADGKPRSTTSFAQNSGRPAERSRSMAPADAISASGQATIAHPATSLGSRYKASRSCHPSSSADATRDDPINRLGLSSRRQAGTSSALKERKNYHLDGT